MLQIGKVYKYQWPEGDYEYFFLTTIDVNRVEFYSLNTPDIIETEWLQWATNYWEEV